MEFEKCKDLYDMVIEKLHSDIEEVPFEEIKKIRKIVIIKSINDEQFNKVISTLKNENERIEIYVIGNSFSKDWCDDSHFFEHKGKFGEYDQINIAEELKKIDADVLLYEDYAIYRNTYLNVMEYVTNLPQMNSQIWAYSVNERKFIKHRDLRDFVQNLKIICPLAHYLNYLAMNEYRT